MGWSVGVSNHIACFLHGTGKSARMTGHESIALARGSGGLYAAAGQSNETWPAGFRPGRRLSNPNQPLMAVKYPGKKKTRSAWQTQIERLPQRCGNKNLCCPGTAAALIHQGATAACMQKRGNAIFHLLIQSCYSLIST